MNFWPRLLLTHALSLLFICAAACSFQNDGVPDERDLDETSRAVLRRVKRPGNISRGDWDKALKIYKMKMIRNIDIVFHGKVVDQNLSPVPDVQISGHVSSFNPQYIDMTQNLRDENVYIQWTARTDANGFFSVSGHRGYSLAVNKIEKHGYLALDLPFSYSYSHERIPGKWTARGAPAELKIWFDDGARPELVKKQVRIRFPHDDIERRVDLLQGGQATTNDVPFDIGLRVNLTKGVGEKAGFYRWTYALQAPGGGLIEMTDRTPLKAPAEGYAASLSGEIWEKRPWLSEYLYKTFYVRSRDGQLYAAITMDFDGDHNGYTDVSIRSVVNPSGSRDLFAPFAIPSAPP